MSGNVKFSMTLGQELNDYCVAEAKRIGITKNAYIAMCIDTIKRQSDSMTMTKEANAMFEHIKAKENKTL
ncbi:hypothetical protein IV460_18545 [Enterococcus casseliflavus]|uniref:hypothetical protein n=1 Tax=Enterococcus casseliflavus TaxID=37734 RepID=UPI001E48F884|nr:hypothetical protein [Enterococcus casseliflavus]MCD5192998.1 hypothetical protein [Enterococcus casseliflavus]